ncbi:MAG: hypothetical protein ABL996_22715 [Micropepsaceae bacterium]
MFRILTAMLIVAAFGAAAVAAVQDNGPPYTDRQFLELAPERLPQEFLRNDLDKWWSRAPGYLRSRVLNTPSQKWWFVILCNFQGFKPEGMEAGGADKCERDAYENSQHKKGSWSANGEWIGPSEECRKRDKRTQWGELICD